MSTKIYEAYKIPQNKIKEFSSDIFGQYEKQTKTRMAYIIKDIKIDSFYKYAIEKNRGVDNVNQDVMSFIFVEWLADQVFLPASNSTKKSFLDVKYGLWVYPHKKDFLIIPQKPQWLWYDLVSYEAQDYVKDFSYWNNSDKPNDVSNREWSAREKVWDDAFENSVCFYLAGLDTSNKWDLWEFIHKAIEEIQ